MVHWIKNCVTDNQWRIQDFPEEGTPTPRGGGAPTYEFAKFSQKLHERIWTGRGGASLAPPLDPPLITVFNLFL